MSTSGRTVQHYQAEISRLESRVAELTRERDAAFADLQHRIDTAPSEEDFDGWLGKAMEAVGMGWLNDAAMSREAVRIRFGIALEQNASLRSRVEAMQTVVDLARFQHFTNGKRLHPVCLVCTALESLSSDSPVRGKTE